MDHFARLQLVGRITYYLGWFALLCAGSMHLNIGRATFQTMGLTQRNLLEAAVVCFLICVASELRALAVPGMEKPSILKRAA
jgi:hypothetical protein